MSACIDMSGQRFGRLVVIERAPNEPGEKSKWRCLCDCGEEKIIARGGLVRGTTQSCGCLHREITSSIKSIDISGQRFGLLVAIKRVPNRPRSSSSKRTAWSCQCDCGNTKIIETAELRNRDTTSCGCARYGLPANRQDITGQVFGELTAISRSPRGPTWWICRCSCGTERELRAAPLLEGRAKSCGLQNCAWAAYRAANPVPAPENRRRRMYHQTLAVVDRDAIWLRDSGVCHLCYELADPTDWHLDHIIPIVHGGPHDPRNVAVSHPFCNTSKNDRISFSSSLIANAIEAYEELHERGMS